MKRKYNYHALALAVITLVGIVLRLYKFSAIPFMYDELSAVGRLSFDNFSDLIDYGVRGDGHPAGVQTFLWLWSKLFGISELSLRIPFLIMGISCVPLMYVVAKMWFNKTAALFASAIMATSQYVIFHTVTIRPYIAGLFFVLLLLIFWTKMVFRQDFRLKNIIAFAVFAAICAYTHQFSMLTAFFIAVTGLFFIKKKEIRYYLAGCLAAVLLYLPHTSILLGQMELKGIGGWLQAPTPAFFSQYLQYLLHFSWITGLGVAVAVVGCSRFEKKSLQEHGKKIIISFLLFLLPILVGYLYSIFVDSVLQYSVLIFSFPFLILFVCSFINEKLTAPKSVFIFVLMAVMIYGLVVVREHYTVMQRQWFEISYRKMLDYRKEKGDNNVACALSMSPRALKYYNAKYETDINNINVYKECYDYCFEEKLQERKENYLVAGGLEDVELRIVQEYYPYLIDYLPCFTSEIYVFSKTPTEAKTEGMPLIYREEFLFEEGERSEEYVSIKTFALDEVSDSRFSKILLTLDFETDSLNPDYAVVMETMRNGEQIDWRSCNTKGYRINKENNRFEIFLPFRFELLVKNSKELSQYSVKTYLWNIEKQTSVKPLKGSLSIFCDNRYIYGTVERVE